MTTVTRTFREAAIEPLLPEWRSLANQIPFALTLLRLFLAPTILLVAWDRGGPWAYTGILTLALLSDIFDGVIARRLRIATADLRRLDSGVDTVFFLSAIGALAFLTPGALSSHSIGIGAILILKAIRSTFELIKFGRRSSYHMYSAKFWALTIFAALVTTAFHGPGFYFDLALWTGLLTNLEGLAASAVLTRWAHDVPSLWHAFHRERSLVPARPATPCLRQLPASKRRSINALSFLGETSDVSPE